MGEVEVLLSVGSDHDWQKQVEASLDGRAVVVVGVASGREALERCREQPPSLVLVDMCLPDMTGLGLCRTLRGDELLSDVPIVMVSSYASEIDRIMAFEAGVDDYLVRPFYRRELASRVSAILRRRAASGGSEEAQQTVRHGPLAVDTLNAVVKVNGRTADLTPRQFQVLLTLVRHRGRVLTRREILSEVWGADTAHTERIVDAHIKAIRRRLGAARDCIESVRGVGYRVVEPEPKSIHE